MKAKIEKLARHRNGISGMPFYVAVVKEGKSRKVVVRLDEAKAMDKKIGAIGCFVLDISLLAKNIIEFAENSWRGDQYSDMMDKAIAKEEGKS